MVKTVHAVLFLLPQKALRSIHGCGVLQLLLSIVVGRMSLAAIFKALTMLSC